MVYDISNYDSFKTAIEEICAYLSSHAVSAEKIFDCKLISHELIGNVFQHADGGVKLRVNIEKERIYISVKAEKIYQPPQTSVCPDAQAERGRGLYFVDCLSVERFFTDEGEITVIVSIL
ncbi:MAG: hypothetical protein J6B05_00370 [Clostridia bacterium]|nr:hypothetical protein [Clostridia bacterium]